MAFQEPQLLRNTEVQAVFAGILTPRDAVEGKEALIRAFTLFISTEEDKIKQSQAVQQSKPLPLFLLLECQLTCFLSAKQRTRGWIF